jgi:phage terminase large subunit-like protein
LLKEIWDKALAGERVDSELPIYRHVDSSLLALIDTGEASWRMLWTTGEAGRRYMAEIRENERPNTFRRLYLNEWVANESQFISREQWEACLDSELRPFRRGDQRPLILAADASTSGDSTALVGVHYNAERERVEILYSRLWRPQRGVLRGGRPTVDLAETLGAEVQRLVAEGVHISAVVCDPYQLHTLILAWEKQGIKVIEFPQGPKRVEADQALYAAVVSKAVVHFGDPALSEHILNAIAIETVRGYRLAKEKTTRKIDGAVALSMAHHIAYERGNRATMADLKDLNETLAGFHSRWEGIPLPAERTGETGTHSTHLVQREGFKGFDKPDRERRWKI